MNVPPKPGFLYRFFCDDRAAPRYLLVLEVRTGRGTRDRQPEYCDVRVLNENGDIYWRGRVLDDDGKIYWETGVNNPHWLKVDL